MLGLEGRIRPLFDPLQLLPVWEGHLYLAFKSCCYELHQSQNWTDIATSVPVCELRRRDVDLVLDGRNLLNLRNVFFVVSVVTMPQKEQIQDIFGVLWPKSVWPRSVIMTSMYPICLCHWAGFALKCLVLARCSHWCLACKLIFYWATREFTNTSVFFVARSLHAGPQLLRNQNVAADHLSICSCVVQLSVRS